MTNLSKSPPFHIQFAKKGNNLEAKTWQANISKKTVTAWIYLNPTVGINMSYIQMKNLSINGKHTARQH